MSIENRETGIHQPEPLRQAFIEIHKKEPEGLQPWEIARQIVEVVDEPDLVNPDLAKECIQAIVNEINYPDDETRVDIVLYAEEKARSVFPELAEIRDVHMAQIEVAYNKWKEGR